MTAEFILRLTKSILSEAKIVQIYIPRIPRECPSVGLVTILTLQHPAHKH